MPIQSAVEMRDLRLIGQLRSRLRIRLIEAEPRSLEIARPGRIRPSREKDGSGQFRRHPASVLISGSRLISYRLPMPSVTPALRSRMQPIRFSDHFALLRCGGEWDAQFTGWWNRRIVGRIGLFGPENWTRRDMPAPCRTIPRDTDHCTSTMDPFVVLRRTSDICPTIGTDRRWQGSRQWRPFPFLSRSGWLPGKRQRFQVLKSIARQHWTGCNWTSSLRRPSSATYATPRSRAKYRKCVISKNLTLRRSNDLPIVGCV